MCSPVVHRPSFGTGISKTNESYSPDGRLVRATRKAYRSNVERFWAGSPWTRIETDDIEVFRKDPRNDLIDIVLVNPIAFAAVATSAGGWSCRRVSWRLNSARRFRRRFEKQSSRVCKAQWVRVNVHVGVDAASESDGIGVDVSSDPRIVVSEVVVVEVGFLVVVLAGESEIASKGA